MLINYLLYLKILKIVFWELENSAINNRIKFEFFHAKINKIYLNTKYLINIFLLSKARLANFN